MKGSDPMDPVQKASINALAAALKSAVETAAENTDTVTAADFINALIREPDSEKRKTMMKDYAERHKDAEKFLWARQIPNGKSLTKAGKSTLPKRSGNARPTLKQ